MPRPADPLVRVKLLAAAEAEFVEHGLDGAKVEQITRRAKISKGAFYLHFSSKGQLFRELVEAFVARLAALTDATLERCQFNPETPPDELLDQWVSMDVEVFEFVWQNRGFIRLLLEGGSGARFRYLVDDFLARMAEKSRRVIEQCVRLGMYRDDLDLEIAAELIAGAYDRLASNAVRQTSRPDFRPLLVHVQSLILFGMASVEFAEKLSVCRARTPHGAEPPAGVQDRPRLSRENHEAFDDTCSTS